jgi:YfiH family protein
MSAPFLTHPAFSFPRIRYGFFTREGGMSEGFFASLNCGANGKDNPAHVARNLRRVAEAVEAADENLVFCRQIHSKIVHEIKTPWVREDRPQGDALVTDAPAIALGVLSADCAPVLFHDPVKNIIGAAHAGWKGAVGGVGEETITAMERKGSQAKDIHAVIGPCIQQNSYEVGPEFPEPFLKQDAAYKNFFKPALAAEKYLFDLPGYIKARLLLRGVKQALSLGYDTASDVQRFFSYRRAHQRKEPNHGTLISVITLTTGQ